MVSISRANYAALYGPSRGDGVQRLGGSPAGCGRGLMATDPSLLSQAGPGRDLWAQAAVRERFRAGELLSQWFEAHPGVDIETVRTAPPASGATTGPIALIAASVPNTFAILAPPVTSDTIARPATSRRISGRSAPSIRSASHLLPNWEACCEHVSLTLTLLWAPPTASPGSQEPASWGLSLARCQDLGRCPRSVTETGILSAPTDTSRIVTKMVPKCVHG